MKVYIGSYNAAVFGAFSAYLGVNSPKYDNLHSCVLDDGCIILEGERTEHFIRSPHDFWRLSNLLGETLANAFMKELARYASKSFYYAYDHSQCGRLYFEPTHPDDDPHCNHYRVSGNGSQVLTLAGFDDLMHFICADKVSGDVSWLPSGEEVNAAISVGKRMAKGIQLTHAALRHKIVWTTADGVSDNGNSVKNSDAYKTLSSINVEPSKTTFLHDFAQELLARCSTKTSPCQAELDNAVSMLSEAGIIHNKFQAV